MAPPGLRPERGVAGLLPRAPVRGRGAARPPSGRHADGRQGPAGGPHEALPADDERPDGKGRRQP
eukprot:3649921-Heterocapsa_arctica.AAC.1